MENNAKGATLIKVSSIIMTILGVFSFIFAILGIFGIIAFDFLTFLLLIWTFIYPICLLAVGIMGIMYSKSTDEKNMKQCFILGTVLIIIMILDYVIGYILNGLYGVSIISVIRFIFPILYLIGVSKNKKSNINDNDIQ